MPHRQFSKTVNFDTVILSLIGLTLFILYRMAHKQRLNKYFSGSWATSNSKHKAEDLANLKEPPGPWGFPFLGHLLFLMYRPHKTLTKWSKKYGEIFQIRLGPRKAVVINGSDRIHNILIHKGSDVAGRPDLPSFKLVNNGCGMIFNSCDGGWQVKKMLLQKALNNYWKGGRFYMDDLLLNHSNKLVSELLESGGKPFNPSNVIARYSSNLFYQILFCNAALSEEEREKEVLEIVTLFESIIKVSVFTTATDFFPFLKPFFTRQIKQFQRVNEIIENSVEKQQARSIETYSTGMTRDVTDGLVTALNVTDTDDLALAKLAGTQGRLRALRLMGDLLGAGQSTVSNSLRWLLLHMAVFPEIQTRVHNELFATLPADHLPTPDDEASLPYTAAVILESRRHSVPFPLLVPHSAMRDIDLDGYFVAKGTVLLFNIWSASRDTRVWKDPETFLPERFLNLEKWEVDRNMRQRFLGFGAGRRRCIGNQLGNASVFTIFANLMLKCRVSIPEKESTSLEGIFGFSLDAQPYKLIIEPIRV